MRNRWWAAPGAAAALALLAACGSSAASGGSSASSAPVSSAPATTGVTASTSAAGIKMASSGKGMVLETAQGYTIYWFAIDTPTKSNCTGTCASFWPPLIGKPSAAAGSSLSGKFGTIKRAGGQLQATYDGHPLYLYKGDTAPGEVHGNGINTSGGLWWAMTPTGAKLAAASSPAPSKSSSGGGGGGYGY
jgi:predicted lipoprotein with Yx(FWY)xxD motif